jgi:mRNA-degrading endonuclease YafQ of YafQ-DinJ toxin-antitoxin module
MWTVYESKAATRALDRAPPQVAEKYEYWRAVVQISGPLGLRPIRGFRDEALAGPWEGHRASRLSDQWRIIYRAEATTTSIFVERVSAHNYRK